MAMNLYYFDLVLEGLELNTKHEPKIANPSLTVSAARIFPCADRAGSHQPRERAGSHKQGAQKT
jgi:hypothetical protein